MQSGIIGKTIDNYRITGILGKGGMGVVYKAEDTTLDRDVALKMMDFQLATDQNFLKRFQSEAKALAKLQNPSIVAIFALRESEFGLCIVMEYVDGRTLTDMIRDGGPMPIKDAVPIFKQILSALDHAHQAGIVHRDIKPSNVMITARGVVKVADFGLAKIQQPSAATMTVGTGGTLFYMSPEQIKGLANVDSRGDIYSLGMTLYEALTGVLPFSDNDSDFSIRQAIVEGNIAPPDKFKPDLPKELVRIVMKAIDKDPARRFQTAAEMIGALEKIENGKPVTGRPEAGSTAGVTGKTTQSSKRLVVLAAAALVIGLFFTARYFLTPATAALSITTTPPGSSVVANGQWIGKTPVDYSAKPGVVKMRVEQEGFLPRDTSITVNEGEKIALAIAMQESPQAERIEKSVTETGGPPLVKPQPKRGGEQQEVATIPSATLVVRAVPGGSVSVDGNIKTGNASNARAIQVDAGERVVQFQHPVYGSKKFSVNVGADETKKLTCYFESYVSIQALTESGSSTWGSIVIDGQNTGVQTPKDRYPIGPGSHTVTVTRTGYETLEGEKEITVEPTLEERVIPFVFHLRKK